MSKILQTKKSQAKNRHTMPVIKIGHTSGILITLQEQFKNAFIMLAKGANDTNLSKGFDNSKTDDLVLHALIHSEIAEATEAVRKNKMDDKIIEFTGQEAELADTVIRIMTMSAAKNLRVAEAIIAKMEYNKGRPFKHGDKRI